MTPFLFQASRDGFQEIANRFVYNHGEESFCLSRSIHHHGMRDKRQNGFTLMPSKQANKYLTRNLGLNAFRAEDVIEMFDFLSDSMAWIKDDKLAYRWVNHAFLLNFSLANKNQIIGQTDHDFTPAYLADLYRADDMRVLAGKTIVARVEPVGTLAAIPRWNQTWKQPLRNRNGKIIGALGLTKPLPDTGTPEFPYPELVPVLDYMRTYCTGSITNTELADLAALSVRAFERKFKRHIHMTPNQFLMRMRITRAAADLCNTFDSISDIAYRQGFSDQSHLSREFRKHFSTTPLEYRKRHAREGSLNS